MLGRDWLRRIASPSASHARGDRQRQPKARLQHRGLRFESLETRALMATNLASIVGTVFNDANGNGVFESGLGETGIGGVSVSLTGTDANGAVTRPAVTTAANGTYRFDNLRAGTYQVRQDPPAPPGFVPAVGASPQTIVVSAAQAMGVAGVIIDAFDGTTQSVTAVAPGTNPNAGSEAGAGALGGPRDVFANVTSATGTTTVRVNTPFLPGVAEIDPGSSSIGSYRITWDGDTNPNVLDPVGLRVAGVGVDLTNSGASTGIQLMMGFDIDNGAPTQSMTLRIYTDGTNYSQTTINLPDTGGSPSAEIFVPFTTGFSTGTGATGPATFSNVGAVEIELQSTVVAMDGQIDFVQAFGPTQVPANFANVAATPGINIEKATNGQDADTPTGPVVLVGSNVTFTYTLTNTGNVPLEGVVVTDDNGTAGNTADNFSPTFTGGDLNSDGRLDLNETWTYTATRPAATGQYVNIAAVSAQDAARTQVTDTDPSHHFGVASGVHIEKSTNGQDADTTTGPLIAVGGAVTWEYVVTNTGNTQLDSVVVTDDRGVSISFIGGDTDADNRLDIAETWTYRATGTAVAGQYSNVGTVVGNPVNENGADIPDVPNVTDTDPSNYFGVLTGIHVEKATNGQDADTGTGPQLPVGSTATFTYVVTNTGNVQLGSVVVTDDRGVVPTFVGGDTDSDGRLDVSESWSYQGTTTVTTGQYTNIATAVGNPVDASGVDIPQLPNVTDTDPSNHFGVSSGINLQKLTNGQDANTPTGPTLFAGSLATFTFIVTNSGNTTLTNVVLTDDNGTPGNSSDDFMPTFVSGDTNGNGQLESTEVWNYTASRTVTVGQFVNTATVTARDPQSQVLTDTDPSHHLGEPAPGPFSKRRFLASS